MTPGSLATSVPIDVNILGVANPTTAVTVNGTTAYRKGDYFWQALSVGNSSAAQYPLVTEIRQGSGRLSNWETHHVSPPLHVLDLFSLIDLMHQVGGMIHQPHGRLARHSGTSQSVHVGHA